MGYRWFATEDLQQKIMESPLEIHRFELFPSSPEAFSSQIESKNVPSVFDGCVKDWKAFSKWNPSNGGLDYLQERVGSSVVEAMLSRSAPVFYGDLRSHERVPLPFSTFITACKWSLQKTSDIPRVCAESEECRTVVLDAGEVSLSSRDAQQVYLAQVPILNIENKEKSPLENLQDDIQMPAFLETKPLASINLWMNSAQSQSSTHYDPHHNLLCIIAGCKQVVLWPPSACSVLYPMSIYGESSNHSSVDIEGADLSIHSRAKRSVDYSQKIVLHAGDALFIPEGWFHQVDSEDLTIAVNFWWQSNMMSSMVEHMDAYYLRRIIRRLVDKEMNQTLHRRSLCNKKAGEVTDVQHSNGAAGHCDRDSEDQTRVKDSKVSEWKDETMLQCLEPHALQALHELVSLVHESVNVSGQSKHEQSSLVHESVNVSGQSKLEQSTSMKGVADNLKGKSKQDMASTYHLEDDPVANIFWTLKPLMLRKIFLAMVQNFPRTLETLILHMLTSVGAEVLTQKFDEMDQQATKEEQSKFYRLFYSVFDDQFAAMDAILNGKESFAAQAFRNVLDQYLGVNFDKA